MPVTDEMVEAVWVALPRREPRKEDVRRALEAALAAQGAGQAWQIEAAARAICEDDGSDPDEIRNGKPLWRANETVARKALLAAQASQSGVMRQALEFIAKECGEYASWKGAGSAYAVCKKAHDAAKAALRSLVKVREAK